MRFRAPASNWPPSGFAIFSRDVPTKPIVGAVIGLGRVDELTDRRYLVLDTVDGRVHYVEINSFPKAHHAEQGMIVRINGRVAKGRSASSPQLIILSHRELDRLANYNGPTWLDRLRGDPDKVPMRRTGFGAVVEQALADRENWLRREGLVKSRDDRPNTIQPGLLRRLQNRELAKLHRMLATELKQPIDGNSDKQRLSVDIRLAERTGSLTGLYERSIDLPSRKIAVIRNANGLTLAPWNSNLESFRGREVIGRLSATHATWQLARTRKLERSR